MIKKYRNYILGLIGILLVLTIFIGIDYLMQSKSENLPEVKLREITDSKAFAIMVQNGNTYEEYNNSTWPGTDYVFKEAKCTDNNGALVDNAVTFADGKATLTTNQTIYCTLYFDEKPIPEIVKQLKAKDKEVSNGIEHLSEQGGMYRYQGTDNVPNWILFGTRTNCEKDEDNNCTNLNMTYDDYVDIYMYRIIGITKEGQMYLLKETFLKDGTTKTFKWNNTDSITNLLEDNCEWSKVDLNKRLNGETSNGNPIFVNSTQYDYLKSGDNDGVSGSEWYQLIANHDWMYGDTTVNDSSVIYNGNEIYGIETGNTSTKRYWPDETQTTCSSSSKCTEKDYTWINSAKNVKIGLMYIHDVVYAYYDGNDSDTRGNPGSSTNVANSWIHFQKDGYNRTPIYAYEWLITRYGIQSSSNLYVDARDVSSTGVVSTHGVFNTLCARPVFYLESSAQISSGDGTKDSPFILA